MLVTQGGNTMGYNVIDLIDKAINISIRRKEIFEYINKENSDVPSIKIMSKVLIKEVDTTISYYGKLKNELYDIGCEEIDFGTYDKISFLINEFNMKMFIPHINNVREYLKFSLDLEKDTYSLLIDMQGRLVKNKSDIDTATYKTLTDIIRNLSDHIVSLEKTIK